LIPSLTTAKGRRAAALAVAGVALAACGSGRGHESEPAGGSRPPSILLVTLDTTRADAIGPEA
jgi:hypothetical protein